MYELTFTEITDGSPRSMIEEPGTVYRAWDAPIGDTDLYALIFTTFTPRSEGDLIRTTEYYVCKESVTERTGAKYQAIKQDHTWETLPMRSGGASQACREYVAQPWPPEAHRMIEEALEMQAEQNA